MGWNSWNSGIPLTEQTVEATIDAMVASGMREAGYRYANLDAGWAAPTRGADGKLRADPTEFPDGIGAVATYAHDRGMLLGIYASPFDETCGQDLRIGSRGKETTDAQTFASWGVDYLKYDWCRKDADHGEQLKAFTAMHNALRATARHILIQHQPEQFRQRPCRRDVRLVRCCRHGANHCRPGSGVAERAPPIDSSDPFLQRAFLGVPDEFAASTTVVGQSHPGYFNDPDMLVVGLPWSEFFGNHLAVNRAMIAGYKLNPDRLKGLSRNFSLSDAQLAVRATAQPGLTESEQRAYFSLWAMLAAPLIAGNDIRSMSDATRTILTNAEVVAVDQDALVARGVPSAQDPRVLVKPLADGSVAVAFYNSADQPATISTDPQAVGLSAAGCYTVRDLWSHTASTSSGGVNRPVAPHGVVMLRISPRCR